MRRVLIVGGLVALAAFAMAINRDALTWSTTLIEARPTATGTLVGTGVESFVDGGDTLHFYGFGLIPAPTDSVETWALVAIRESRIDGAVVVHFLELQEVTR